VVAKLAGHAAQATYGVVGMRRSQLHRITQMLRGALIEGVQVESEGEAARITLHVVMERGTNLAQITANLQEQVRYQVEHLGGVPVSVVIVRVEDLRE
jgi:uncharacterized alkaline shock family protein YloU